MEHATTPEASAPPPPGWEGLLDADERILWQGRPRAGLSFRGTHPMGILMGLFFMGFSLFWMAMAAKIGGGMQGIGPIGAVFPLFGIPFFLIGCYSAFGHVLWHAYLRRKTHYTLTNKRAFIATDHPLRGKVLADYPIDAKTPVSLVIGPPDTVWFAQGRHGSGDSNAARKLGFEQIEDGRAVFALMRTAQKET